MKPSALGGREKLFWGDFPTFHIIYLCWAKICVYGDKIFEKEKVGVVDLEGQMKSEVQCKGML